MDQNRHVSRRERERKELRYRMLEAGKTLFARGGESALTLRGVAEIIEFSATAIYSYFPQKEALLLEVCESELASFNRSLRQGGLLPDPLARLKAVAGAYIDFGLQYPEHYRVLFMRETVSQTVVAAAPVPSEGAAPPGQSETSIPKNLSSSAPSASHERPGNAYDHLHGAIFKAMAAGCFKPEYCDVALLSQSLWGCLHGIIALHLVRARHAAVAWKPVQHLAEITLEAFLNGLANPSKQLPLTWRK